MTDDRNTFHWVTKEGDEILLKDLSLDHLVNIGNWVRMEEGPTGEVDEYRPHYSDWVVDTIDLELNYRAMGLFSLGEPYPLFTDDKWTMVDEL